MWEALKEWEQDQCCWDIKNNGESWVGEER